MNSLILLLLVMVAVLAGQSGAARVARQANCDGRLTGHLTLMEESLLSRSKRQAGGRRGGGNRGGRRRNTEESDATTISTSTSTTTTTTTSTATSSTSSSTSASIDCSSLKYRTEDGSCNNLKYPSRGSADQPFIRLLDPEYTIVPGSDGNVYAPRRYSDVSQAELPNVRLISRFIHDPDDRPARTATIMAMQWGQFLDHDITATPVNPENITCCSDTLVLNDQQHEDVNTNGPCFPIIIPDGDTHFTAVENRCMENKRSYQETVNEVPEQINIISAFVDGSQVYGSTTDQTAALRSTENGLGRLAEKNSNLPEGSSSSCLIDEGREGVDYCLMAGDSRVNVYPGLGVLHTIYMRMHNVTADGLAGVHPEWDDETVFQQARRINIALLQKITYTEYLQAVLGNTNMAKYRLNSGNYAYEEETDPTLANVFSTAAFRFGHSMIPDGLSINNLFFESISLFNNPRHVIHSLDSIVEGLLEDTSQRVDRWYSTGMTNHMFETSAFNGLDIVALNIQRGRDHGLPAYNKWRVFCDQTAYTTFDEMDGSSRRYSNVYGDVNDIDLYSGALNEQPTAGGLVGVTYGCLIGKQFEALKYGDRFWYENTNSPTPFTTQQIQQIERQRLASVLCQTTGIQSIQRNVFRPVDTNNNVERTCDEFSVIDYSIF